MRYLLALVAAASMLAAVPRHTASHRRREHFIVTIIATSGTQRIQAFTDQTPPMGGYNARPVLRVVAGSQVHLEWSMKSAFPHGTMKGVGVHFFVVHEQAVNQKPVPDPAGPAGVLDNLFTMDYPPSAASAGAATIRLTDAGDYLARIQSENTWQVHGHEHFSALDIVVSPPPARN
ncbi:MAG: hypothetical protein KGJ62_05880 [Armatimonadetes bacterium]|nr:hypothetical protein [Armatimonadota bacterium]MDE2206024.1 hypothetical protein [Armatimonadota bacterium]